MLIVAGNRVQISLKYKLMSALVIFLPRCKCAKCTVSEELHDSGFQTNEEKVSC